MCCTKTNSLWKQDSKNDTNLIAHQTTQGALALWRDPSRNAGGPDFARLSDHDVARGIFLTVVVQYELRQLSGLSTACASSDDHHRVVFYEGNQLEMCRDDKDKVH